jgi:hypothetical protein
MDIEPIQLLSLAKQAGDAYLKEGKALNDTIAKLADERELNPHQINRIVEETNHYVQAELYKSAEDKTFTFDLADAAKIVEKVKGPGMPKVAFFDAYRTCAPAPAPERVRAFMEKVAAASGTGKCSPREAVFILQKVASQAINFRDEITLRRIENQTEIQNALEKIAQDAKDHVCQNGGTVSDLHKYACLAFPDSKDLFGIVFKGIRNDLEKLGAPVEKELIANQMEMPDGTIEIINGEHHLLVDLDTLKNKISDDDKNAHFVRLLDTFGDAIVDRLRVLRTVEDIDKSVMEDVHALEKKADEGADAFCEFLKEGGIAGKLLGLAALVGGGAALMKIIREATRGAAKEAGRTRDETAQLKAMTGAHGGSGFPY